MCIRDSVYPGPDFRYLAPWAKHSYSRPLSFFYFPPPPPPPFTRETTNYNEDKHLTVFICDEITEIIYNYTYFTTKRTHFFAQRSERDNIESVYWKETSNMKEEMTVLIFFYRSVNKFVVSKSCKLLILSNDIRRHPPLSFIKRVYVKHISKRV